jgi:hypothetical protein
LLLAVLVIPACGKSHSGFVATSPSATRPVAIVPENKKVLISAANVSLDGSKSHDSVVGAPALTYLWEQTAGTAVTLSSVTAAAPTFTAPASPGTLTFKLTVTGAQGTDSASVSVSVQTFLVSAPDQWFVGYGNSGSITATVTGSTAAPVYSWTGIAPWLTASGTSSLILNFTAPPLTDFQNFEDVPGVALMERTTQGRLQLTITVTDGLVSDQAFVNFSVGPFADSAANENVALGNPVFLNGAVTVNGAPITSWVWSGTKPDGSIFTSTALPTSDFKTPNKLGLNAAGNQPFVYFVPNQVGSYQIQISQSPGPVVQVVTINCGRYVGVGNLTNSIPDPFKGECAACHAGQLAFVPNFADPWKLTQHAHVFEEMVDPTHPLYGPSQAKGSWKNAFDFVPPGGLTPQQLRSFEFSVDSRSVGWSQITTGSIGGWVEQATAEGFALGGATWAETLRKNPLTASRSNTQCESCHGPGSEHVGDTAGIRKSFDSLVCGRCHAQKEDLWDVSAHADRTSAAFKSASGSGSCNGCHTSQGFVVEMNAQQTADPHPVLFAIANVNRPVIAINDRRTQTCQTCHDPHQNTIGLGGVNPDPQLRSFGNVQFRNGATVNAGRAAVCYMCHQSRTDTRDNSADMNVRRAPHDSTAAEMLSGTNGIQFPGWTYNVSPHGIPSRFLSSSGENRQCLACHNDVQPAAGTTGFGALGGHSFNMTQGTGTSIADNVTNPTASTVGGTRKFTISGGPGFLKGAFPGDTLLITAGADASGTPYTVASVDSASQLSLVAGGNFAGGAATAWSLVSVQKYNTGACVQCHTTAQDFRDVARARYDGNLALEPVQDEIGNLLGSLAAAINAKLAVLLGNGNYSFTVASGRIVYALTPKLTTGPYLTFPGPGVPASGNPLAWASLTPTQQADWLTLYKAAYNWSFVTNDRSAGIHNTGYAVNLLQSAYQAVTGGPIGSPFVPF